MKSKAKFIRIIALFGGFTLLLFAPLELFITNREDFWFGIKDLSKVMALFFISYWLIIEIIIFIIKRFEKVSNVFATFLFYLFLCIYIQGNYIIADYGVLDGKDIDWNHYKIYGYVSIAVWLLIFVLVGLLIKIKGFDIFTKLASSLSLILLVVQCCTLIILYLQAGNSQKHETILTDRNLLHISADKNIMMICLDAFDSAVMQELINDPEVLSVFNGFTYYPDTVGAYPTTKGALPQVLTGQWYDNSVPYAEYVESAYEKSELYSSLMENNYYIGIYTSNMFVADGFSDNVENASKIQYAVTSNFELGKMMYKLVAFKYVPQQMKKNFLMYTGDFEQVRTVENVTHNGGHALYQDVNWYYDRLQEGFETEAGINSFKFYHTSGIHPPYTLNKDVEDVGETDIEQESYACVKLISRFCEQLKLAGVYENTAIIILADHGQYNSGQNPLLMIKKFGAQEDELQISDVAVSYDNLTDLLLGFINGGESGDDVWQLKNSEGKRYFRKYQWDDGWGDLYLPDMIEYVTDSSVSDLENFRETGVVFSAK